MESWTPPWDKLFETDQLIQDFSYAGYHMGETSLPSATGPIFNVMDYGADATGAKDSTEAIQKAIDAAGAKSGGVVYLPEGKFTVSPPGKHTYSLYISHSNVVLRGAGPEKTFLFNNSWQMRQKSIILAEGGKTRWKQAVPERPATLLTADLLKPTVTIPVASVDGLKTGDWIILRTDVTPGFLEDHHMTDRWGGMEKRLLGVMYERQIRAIEAAKKEVTIDVPIRYYLKTRDNARVYLAPPHLEEVGIESLSVGNVEPPTFAEKEGWGQLDFAKEGLSAYEVHASAAITFNHVRNGWIKNVATYHPKENKSTANILSNGIVLDESRGITVANCDFEHALYGGGGGNGYMYRIESSNECLVRDCICAYSRHSFVIANMASSGNVYLHGRASHTQVEVVDTGRTGGKGSDHHMYLSQSDLVDSMTMDDDFFDAHFRIAGDTFGTPIHGQTSVHSVFWNLKGLSYHGKDQYVVHSDQARWGYVIGTSGPASAVDTSSVAVDRTAPVDFVEGVGKGETLEPQSLYEDQLKRRLAALKSTNR